MSQPIFQSVTTAISQCKYGPMMYLKNDMYIGRSLAAYGEWCEREIELLLPLLKTGDVVLDVGANIGTHTIPFAQAVGVTGQVIAFEAQRAIHGILTTNMLINDLQHALCLNVAAGHERGRLMVPRLDVAASNNFGGLNVHGHPVGEPVEMIRIDDLGLSRCNLIKIDVEGAEAGVLRGAEKTILTHRPFLFVENNGEETATEINLTLMGLGYQCWWFLAHNFRPDNFRGNPEDIFEGSYIEANLFCIPQEVNANIANMQPLVGPDDHWRKAGARVFDKAS